MKVLVSNGKLLGLKSTEHKLCECYLLKKKEKKKKMISFFKVGGKLKEEKSKLVHMDV